MLPWTKWSLSGTSQVFWDGEAIPFVTGVQQGDPLAPALFAAGLHDAVEKLCEIPDLQQVWYLDDGLLFGTPETVQEALKQLEQLLAEKGLVINPTK